MRHFIGRYPLNYAPISNERVMLGLKQYADRAYRSTLDPENTSESDFIANCPGTRKPHDHIAHLLYPFHDHKCGLLDKCGISTALYDSQEKFGYDFYNEVGYAKLVSARYIDGYGIYEVESHKGSVRVRSTSWVPQPTGIDAVIRKIEVASVRPFDRTLEVYPQLHLKGELRLDGNILINKVRLYEGEDTEKNGSPAEDFYLAIECLQAGKPFCGIWKRNVQPSGEQAIAIVDTCKEKPNVTYLATRTVQNEEWSEPVYLLIGIGRSEAQALDNLNAVKASRDYLYQATWTWWKTWHEQGLIPAEQDEQLNQVLRVSKTIMRMAFDEFGLTTYMGYYWYQGAVWIRDNSWIAMGLARIQYPDEAFRILSALRKIVKKRKDGNFHFLYGTRSHEVGDFSWESDSMGLILTAAGYWFDACQDLEKANELFEWLAYCADWISANIDPEVGLITPDAGIWEEWSDEFGQGREHMTWTSMISAYGVKKAGEIAAALNRQDLAIKYQNAYETLRNGIEQNCIKDNILVRSYEATGLNLDSSVLYGWTWTPMFSVNHPALPATLQAMEERTRDKALDGFWRHENINNDLGDAMPWASATLWAAESYLLLGQTRRSQELLQWILDHTTECSQIAECMFARDISHVTGMSSLSCVGIWGHILAVMKERDATNTLVTANGKL